MIPFKERWGGRLFHRSACHSSGSMYVRVYVKINLRKYWNLGHNCPSKYSEHIVSAMFVFFWILWYSFLQKTSSLRVVSANWESAFSHCPQTPSTELSCSSLQAFQSAAGSNDSNGKKYKTSNLAKTAQQNQRQVSSKKSTSATRRAQDPKSRAANARAVLWLDFYFVYKTLSAYIL